MLLDNDFGYQNVEMLIVLNFLTGVFRTISLREREEIFMSSSTPAKASLNPLVHPFN